MVKTIIETIVLNCNLLTSLYFLTFYIFSNTRSNNIKIRQYNRDRSPFTELNENISQVYTGPLLLDETHVTAGYT